MLVLAASALVILTAGLPALLLVIPLLLFVLTLVILSPLLVVLLLLALVGVIATLDPLGRLLGGLLVGHAVHLLHCQGQLLAADHMWMPTTGPDWPLTRYAPAKHR